MNNEETMVMQPDANKPANKPVNEKVKKSNNGARVAAAAVAAGTAGMAGGAGGAAAMNYTMYNETDDNDAAPLKTEENTAAVNDAEQNEIEEPVSVAARVDDQYEPDYTNHGNADPVVAAAQPVSAVEESAPDIQVLGVYENTTAEGVRQTAAVLTDGSEVAAVVDVDGDGVADYLAVDMNHNQQLDEGEVIDCSDQNVSMSDFQQAYSAQQGMQQMDDMTYNTSSDDMQDYNNDADISSYV